MLSKLSEHDQSSNLGLLEFFHDLSLPSHYVNEDANADGDGDS